MTEFRSGVVRGDQDFGNNILLSKVNEEIRETQSKQSWADIGFRLEKQLRAYLADQRVRDASGETIERVHDTGDGVILVFEGGRYFTVQVEGCEYDECGYVTTGDVISIETARRLDLLQGVANIDKEYKAWQLEDVKRQDANNTVASIRRLATLHGKDFIMKVLEDGDDA